MLRVDSVPGNSLPSMQKRANSCGPPGVRRVAEPRPMCSMWGTTCGSVNRWREKSTTTMCSTCEPARSSNRILNPRHWPTWHHHRCYRDKATPNYILAGRTGVEFISLETGKLQPHNWIRGGCKYGVMPANGMLYLPPEQCGCYIESKLTGFHALAPETTDAARSSRRTPDRCVASRQSSGTVQPAEGDWPTFRADNARSGKATTIVTADLEDGLDDENRRASDASRCGWWTTVCFLDRHEHTPRAGQPNGRAAVALRRGQQDRFASDDRTRSGGLRMPRRLDLRIAGHGRASWFGDTALRRTRACTWFPADSSPFGLFTAACWSAVDASTTLPEGRPTSTAACGWGSSTCRPAANSQ